MSKEFEAYLAKHGLEPEEGVKFVDSSFEEANNSTTEEFSAIIYFYRACSDSTCHVGSYFSIAQIGHPWANS